MDIKPDSNQSSHLYWTAKIQKFENLEDIIKPKLKFSLIVDQTETFTYSGAGGGGGEEGGGLGVISDYLRPLYKYKYSISDTQKFPSMLFSIPPLQDDGENVSYDVKSSFRNITLEETINYIKQIYVHIKLTPVCLKLNFGRLLMKLTTECTLKFDDRFFRQVDCGTL